jgi:hypothetical protein
MAANPHAVNVTLPDEVELDDMPGRIGLAPNAGNRFREVYGYRTGENFLLMDYHKKSANYLFSAMSGGQPPVAFPQILADGVIAARHFAQYKVFRGQVPFTPASYAPNPAAASAVMQRLWYMRARLVMALPSAVPPLVIAPFTDMQRFPAFNSIVAAAYATVRSPGNGIFFTYLSITIGTVTPAILSAPYNNTDQDLVATTLHTGTRYEEDNRIFFRAIALAVADGRLGSFINPHRDATDGRSAYLALVRACHDPSQAPARVGRAKEALRNLRWAVGTDLETYISNSLIQHAIHVNNQHVFDPAEKAMAFRRGLSHNERYRPVSIAWAADTTFEEQCSWIRTAVSNDNDFNRNIRTGDDRRINRADNGPRPPPSSARRPARSPSVPRKIVKGTKLPKSGIELHSGQYSNEDIQLLRQHGEYDEMVAFRAKHASTRAANAVSTSDRQEGDAASLAGHSVHSTGSRSQFSSETASMHSNDRGMAMVVTTDSRRVPIPGTFDFSNHRRINNDPAWMVNPRFASESHAAHSRQHSKSTLGVRWQAPSDRVIEAVLVAPNPAPTPKAPPTKKPTVATRHPIPKSVKIIGSQHPRARSHQSLPYTTRLGIPPHPILMSRCTTWAAKSPFLSRPVQPRWWHPWLLLLL